MQIRTRMLGVAAALAAGGALAGGAVVGDAADPVQARRSTEVQRTCTSDPAQLDLRVAIVDGGISGQSLVPAADAGVLAPDERTAAVQDGG